MTNQSIVHNTPVKPKKSLSSRHFYLLPFAHILEQKLGSDLTIRSYFYPSVKLLSITASLHPECYFSDVFLREIW